jgi:hypothetical protein
MNSFINGTMGCINFSTRVRSFFTATNKIVVSSNILRIQSTAAHMSYAGSCFTETPLCCCQRVVHIGRGGTIFPGHKQLKIPWKNVNSKAHC